MYSWVVKLGWEVTPILHHCSVVGDRQLCKFAWVLPGAGHDSQVGSVPLIVPSLCCSCLCPLKLFTCWVKRTLRNQLAEE